MSHEDADGATLRGSRLYRVAGYEGARALVLGASGFVGRHVAQAVDRAGAQLHVAYRDADALDHALAPLRVAAERHRVDLADEAAVGDLLAELRPDVVFNLAGYGVDPAERDEDTGKRLNSALPTWVVRSLARAPVTTDWGGQRLVHAGSAFEYGAAGGDLREDGPTAPTDDYGWSKLFGTMQTAIFGRFTFTRTVIARLFTVYGPGEHPHRLLPSLCRAAARGEPLELTAGDQRRDFTYVQDVAAGMLRLGAVDVDDAWVVNLASGRLTTVRAFAEAAARVLGLDDDLLRFGALPARPDEMAHEPVSLDRLRERIGWVPPTGIDAGIRASVAFDPSGSRR